MPHAAHARPAFALPELVAAATILVILAAALLVAAGESRRRAGLADDLAGLARIHAAAAAYAADHDDRVFGFTWRAGTDYGFGGAANFDLHAAANQAIHIIRRRTGRDDLQPVTGWVPQVAYSFLVLADYLDEAIPSRALASSADRLLLLWQSDPEEGFYALGPNERPGPPGSDNAGKRWPYSSSYELAPAFWSHDARTSDQLTVSQPVGAAHNAFGVPGHALIARRFAEVVHPAQKAFVYDRYQRHFGPRAAFFGYAEARTTVLSADGSAMVRRSSNSNLGFYPDNPSTPAITQVTYTPAQWEPPDLNGFSSQLVNTYHRFTRSGLRGRDFGGPEVPWSP